MQQRKSIARKPVPRILSSIGLGMLFSIAAVASVYAGDNKATSGQSQDMSASQTSQSGSGASAAATGAAGATSADDAATSGASDSGTSESSTPDAATSGASDSGTSQAKQAGVGQLSEGDEQILRDIAQANLAEIATSQIALERAQDPEIKQFAQRMIEDHTQLHERVAYLGRVKDVQLPKQPDQQHQQLADRLSQLEGENFDREYRKQVGEQAHEKTHQMLQQAQVRADDPQLIALITQAMPVIEMHLTTAEQLDSGTSSGGEQSGASEAGASESTSGGSDDSGTSAGSPTGNAASSDTMSGASGMSDTGDTQDARGATGAATDSAEPAGASGASMSSQSSGGVATDSDASKAESGAESVSGTSGSTNAVGPGKQ